MALRSRDERVTVRRRRVGQLWLSLAGRVIITLFLFWHLFCLAFWNMPASCALTEPALRSDGSSWVRNYMTSTGFMQGWGMFAPDPYSFDVYVTANVRYADGTVREWDFPRMVKMSYYLRWQKERWRKYIEISYSDQYQYLWPVMAKWVARTDNTMPGNPPISVELVRHW